MVGTSNLASWDGHWTWEDFIGSGKFWWPHCVTEPWNHGESWSVRGILKWSLVSGWWNVIIYPNLIWGYCEHDYSFYGGLKHVKTPFVAFLRISPDFLQISRGFGTWAKVELVQGDLQEMHPFGKCHGWTSVDLASCRDWFLESYGKCMNMAHLPSGYLT